MSASSSPIVPAEVTMIPADMLNTTYNGKNYVFTKNNPSSDMVANIGSFGDHLNSIVACNHIYWSLEVGASGTPHIQGYLQLKTKKKLQALKNVLRAGGYWVACAKGSAQDNHDYIGHTGKHSGKAGLLQGPFEFGVSVTASGPGSRSDLDSLAGSIIAGRTVKQLAETHTVSMLKYFGNAQKLVQVLNKKKRSWMTELYIYTGVAGSGKSHSAFEEAKQYISDQGLEEEPYYLPVPPRASDPLWWQDYNGESVIIIDDFYGTIGLDYFKVLIDKYPFKVNLKNGSAEFLGKRVYVTSNQGWRSWWGTSLMQNSNNEAAILRRITVDKHFSEPYRVASAADNANDGPVAQPQDDVAPTQPNNSSITFSQPFEHLAVDDELDVEEIVRQNIDSPIGGQLLFRTWSNNIVVHPNDAEQYFDF